MKIIHDPAAGPVSSVTMRRPSNFHAHFRQGEMMEAVALPIMQHYRYVLAMPNTGPITTIEEMVEYHKRLTQIADTKIKNRKVDVIMTLYLTAETTPAVIEQMAKLNFPAAVKYYPPEPGATTGSGLGIPLDTCDEVLRAMEANGIPLLGHFESIVDKDGHELKRPEREGYMIRNYLWKFRDRYNKLRISCEHASTAEAVKWVEGDTSGNSFMTVTPQHAFCIGDDFEQLGVDLDCQPIVKTAADRNAVVEFCTSGDYRCGAGNDDAPHTHKKKLAGAKGCWTPHAVEIFAEVADRKGRLDHRFEAFMSINAPVWWGLCVPDDDDTITIVRRTPTIPPPIKVPGENDFVVPLGWSEDGSLLDLHFSVV